MTARPSAVNGALGPAQHETGPRLLLARLRLRPTSGVLRNSPATLYPGRQLSRAHGPGVVIFLPFSGQLARLGSFVKINREQTELVRET